MTRYLIINIPTEPLYAISKCACSINSMYRVTEDERKSDQVADGVHLTDLAAGEKMSMKHWRVEPGESLPAHRHHNEQIGYVISGTLTAVVEGKEHELSSGDSYVFPSGELHGAENRGDVPAVGVGILSPPRGEPKWGTNVGERPTVETND